MERNGILGSGSWIVDHIKIIDEWPEQDTLSSVISSRSANGGMPFNILKDLARMNFPAPLQACGLLGEDPDGEFIQSHCRELGIDTSLFITSSSVSTAFTDVMSVASSGRRTFFYYPAGNDQIEPKHMRVEESGAKIFFEGYFGLNGKMDAVSENGSTGHSEIFSKAKSLGFITASDLVSRNVDFSSLTRSSLPHLDYLSLNELELKYLAGGDALNCADIKSEANIKKYASEILRRGINKFLIIHFPECVYAFGQDGSMYKQCSVDFPRERIKGATGAGDAMYAGVLFGVHESWDMADCLRLGVCAAAQCLTDDSASDGMADWRDCLKLADLYGFKEA